MKTKRRQKRSLCPSRRDENAAWALAKRNAAKSGKFNGGAFDFDAFAERIAREASAADADVATARVFGPGRTTFGPLPGVVVVPERRFRRIFGEKFAFLEALRAWLAEKSLTTGGLLEIPGQTCALRVDLDPRVEGYSLSKDGSAHIRSLGPHVSLTLVRGEERELLSDRSRRKCDAWSSAESGDFQAFAEHLAWLARGEIEAFEVSLSVVVHGPRDFEIDRRIMGRSIGIGFSHFFLPDQSEDIIAGWNRRHADRLGFLNAFLAWTKERPGLFVGPDSDRALVFEGLEIDGMPTPFGARAARPSLRIGTKWLELPEVEKLLLDAVLAEVPVAAPTRRSAL